MRLPIVILRKLHRVGTRTLFETAEASIALLVAYTAIKFLPFKVVVRMMGRKHPTDAPLQIEAAEVAGAVRRAIQRAARRIPWPIVCFPQALAAHWMLSRRGFASRVHYGLRNGTDALTGHVWTTLGDAVVVGEEHNDPHHCIALFPPSPV